jgi:hypothetical protein
MKIIIAGAGAVGTHLAKLLSGEKQDIILMDEDESKLSAMGNNLDLMTVNLSPTSINGLKEAGVAGADLFIGVMPDESRNMTACMLATSLGAKKTVARIDNYEYLLPKHKEFFAKLGVHSKERSGFLPFRAFWFPTGPMLLLQIPTTDESSSFLRHPQCRGPPASPDKSMNELPA